MVGANLNDWFKWVFGILCLYVIGTLFFWDYSPHTSSMGDESTVGTDTLLSVIYQSHQVSHGRSKQAGRHQLRHYAAIGSNANHLPRIEYVNDSWIGGRQVASSPQAGVVIFSNCKNFPPRPTSFHDIYAHYDTVILCAEELADAFPRSVLVWVSPVVVLAGHSAKDNADLHSLHSHLTLEHLIIRRGILVIPRVAQNATTLQLSSVELQQLYDQLTFIDQRIQDTAVITTTDSTFNATLTSVAQYQRSLIQRATAYISSLHVQCAKYVPTRRYHPHCYPPNSLAYPLLITGLGGAGTHFVAQRLRSVGWRVLHEDIDVDGSVSWFYGANDRAVGLRYPYGALNGQKSSYLYPRFGHVIHLVRSPAEQISSFTAHSNKTYNFVQRTMQLLHNMSHVGFESATSGYSVDATVLQEFEKARANQHNCLRGGSCHLHFAALSWLHWNRFIRSFADATFRIDQSEEVVRYVCSLELNRTAHGLTTDRFCAIEECPASRTPGTAGGKSFAQDVRQRAFYVVDQIFGVCKINDALFKRSAVHKRHLQYNLSDTARIDGALADEIRRDAAVYGFGRVE